MGTREVATIANSDKYLIEFELTQPTQGDLDVVVTVIVRHRAVVASEVLRVAIAHHQRRLHAECRNLLEHRVVAVRAAIDFPTVIRPSDVSRFGDGEGNAFNLYGFTGNSKLLFRRGD